MEIEVPNKVNEKTYKVEANVDLANYKIGPDTTSITINNLRTLAIGGDADAQFEYGMELLRKNDVTSAIEFIKKAADQKNPEALIKLGNFYHEGFFGFEQNDGLAFDMYKAAANTGSSRGLYKLAMCYEYEIGVKRDPKQAKKLYDQATKKGF